MHVVVGVPKLSQKKKRPVIFTEESTYKVNDHMLAIKSLTWIIRTTWVGWVICADETVNSKLFPCAGRMILSKSIRLQKPRGYHTETSHQEISKGD